MKRTMLPAVGILFLSFAVSFAEDKQPGSEPNQKPEQNQNPAAAAPSVSSEKTGEMEQMREDARQRIRERTNQTHRQQGGVDSNAIASNRGRVDSNLAGGMADINAAQYRKAAIERLLSQQEAKYRDRLARLGRIREIANEQGDANTVEKVDKLIEQDQQLHRVKMQRMNHWQEMMERDKDRSPTSPREQQKGAEKIKRVNIPDANKSVPRPAAGKKQ
jgi:hypothetical protein